MFIGFFSIDNPEDYTQNFDWHTKCSLIQTKNKKEPTLIRDEDLLQYAKVLCTNIFSGFADLAVHKNESWKAPKVQITFKNKLESFRSPQCIGMKSLLEIFQASPTQDCQICMCMSYTCIINRVTSWKFLPITSHSVSGLYSIGWSGIGCSAVASAVD